MKGEYTFHILEAIAAGAGEAADIIRTLCYINPGPGMGRALRAYRNLRRLRNHKAIDRRKWMLMQRRYHNIVSWLKKDGLVTEVEGNKGNFLRITSDGSQKLKALRRRKNDFLLNSRYEVIPGDEFLIISFDIPEIQRRKRHWLRSRLRDFGFRAIQQSVWAGRGKIPLEFIHDLHHLGLSRCVEIFEVKKVGSLREIQGTNH